MRIALLISHYQRTDLLALCLKSIQTQTRIPDEIWVLDDGSDIRPYVWICQSHYIWQPHNKFGKMDLLNRALMETDCDYFIATDQDCVFPPTWIETHETLAIASQYVCGFCTSLNEEQSKLVTYEGIANGSIWNPPLAPLFDACPHIWCGNGSAAWISDAHAINGFDSRFGWCGGDYNFGLRLNRLGCSWDHINKHIQYYHLWHDRPWAEDKTDFRSGDKKTANRLAVEWADQSPIALEGIAQLKTSTLYKNQIVNRFN